MNAIVEVATPKVVAQTEKVTVLVMVIAIPKVSARKVATSAVRVLSIAGSSISAVSPDYNFIGGTAKAA